MPKFANMGTITRDELRHFDHEARALVEDYHAAGWRSRMSNRGHAIMYAPDGKTTASVSYHSEGHIPKVARASLDRWLRRNGKKPTAPTRRKAKPLRRTSERRNENYPKPEPTPTPEPEHNNRMELPMATRYGCPDCPNRDPFATPGALKLHRQRTHDGLQCSECPEVFKGPGSTGRYRTHRREAHGIEPKSKKLGVVMVDGAYPCPWCGKPYAVLGSLAGHSKSHRGEPRPEVTPVWRSAANGEPADARTCPICGEVKPHKNALNGHMRKHKGKANAVEPPKSEAVEVAPSSPPVATLVASGASTDLDAWLAGQNPADLLAGVLAVLAPPLVGEIERLRRQRDDLAGEVEALREDAATLRTKTDDYEARLAIMREAMNL